MCIRDRYMGIQDFCLSQFLLMKYIIRQSTQLMGQSEGKSCCSNASCNPYNEITINENNNDGSTLQRNPSLTVNNTKNLDSTTQLHRQQLDESAVDKVSFDLSKIPASKPIVKGGNKNKSALYSLESINNNTTMYASHFSENAIRMRQLAEAVGRASVLKIKVLSSSIMSKGATITINAQGAEGALRDAKDGITFFGSKKRMYKQGTQPQNVLLTIQTLLNLFEGNQ
eukprot:TRINITY_DN13639_c0_g1_i1.p1 TRINITY_DN13639_c0_g1~~TRINITY_DN13639_c0_g1_i1.p1  ORF type:complete len:255 (+),score=35.23 TRINITY_DN13639_c0_g1_i1:87-767(+)